MELGTFTAHVRETETGSLPHTVLGGVKIFLILRAGKDFFRKPIIKDL